MSSTLTRGCSRSREPVLRGKNLPRRHVCHPSSDTERLVKEVVAQLGHNPRERQDMRHQPGHQPPTPGP